MFLIFSGDIYIANFNFFLANLMLFLPQKIHIDVLTDFRGIVWHFKSYFSCSSNVPHRSQKLSIWNKRFSLTNRRYIGFWISLLDVGKLNDILHLWLNSMLVTFIFFNKREFNMLCLAVSSTFWDCTIANKLNFTFVLAHWEMSYCYKELKISSMSNLIEICFRIDPLDFGGPIDFDFELCVIK